MPPFLVALIEVTALFALFWGTRTTEGAGRKWFLRIAGFVVMYLLAAVLIGDPEAGVKSGEYMVYLGIPAILIYMFASRRTGAGAARSRR
jgi:hypothetical protein